MCEIIKSFYGCSYILMGWRACETWSNIGSYAFVSTSGRPFWLGVLGRKSYISDKVWKSCPVFLLLQEIALRIILIRGPRLQITHTDGSLETDFHVSIWPWLRGVVWSATSSIRHSTVTWPHLTRENGRGEAGRAIRSSAPRLLLSSWAFSAGPSFRLARRDF